MTEPVKATEPERRMGVYKHLDDVPDHYRLYRHAAAYDGRDVWAEYIEHVRATRSLSDSWFDYSAHIGDHWKAHTEGSGRHHALATPEDVETWVAGLLEGHTLKTVYEQYWARLEAFYTWLLYHTEHPHVYQPFLMAAAENDAAGRVWDRKLEGAARKRARGSA